MIDISTEFSPFTLMITIAVPPKQHAGILEELVDTTRDHSRRPGFMSCTLHSSPDNGHLAEYIQWRDRESFEAVAASDEGSQHIQRFLPMSDVSVYDVSAVYDKLSRRSGRMTPRADVLTTVTVIRCASGEQEQLLIAACTATEALRERPGFIAAGVHRGTDRDRVAVYGQWTDEQAWATALSATDVVPLLDSARALGTATSRAYRADFIADGPIGQTRTTN